MFSVKTKHSDPYTTAGLTRALYNFILVFLDISLLWSIVCTPGTNCVNLGCDAVPVGVHFLAFRSILVPSSSGSISSTWNGCAYNLLYIDSIRHAWRWLRNVEVRTNCRVQRMMCAGWWEFDV
jgi:hypothetical protein